MSEKNIIFAIDDSGKIDDQYHYALYGGIMFVNDSDRSDFIGKYSQCIQRMKCKYCKQTSEECDSSCPEVKSHNIRNNHRRQLVNLIKKQYCVVAIIDKNKLTKVNISDKRSKRRFLDYAVKRLIKASIKELLKLKVINENDNISIVVNIDNESRSSNGIYDLRESIYKELFVGVTTGWRYHSPILFGSLNVGIHYRDSKKNYDVQAADIITGTFRRYLLHDKSFSISMRKINEIANVVSILP